MTTSAACGRDPYDPVDCRLALDRSTPVPLWAQIADYLAAAIDEGPLAPGQSLGSEHDLACRFHVARPTIRRALGELSRRGLVSRSRATGTRVSDRLPLAS